VGFWNTMLEKLNPAQRTIANDAGDRVISTQNKTMTISRAFEFVEVVNRCVNIIADNATMVDFDIGATYKFTGVAPNVQQTKLDLLLNMRPNQFMDISTFRRLLIVDFLMDGNCFIYYDGQALYHVPAAAMEIVPDSQGYVNSYKYTNMLGAEITYPVNTIMHIKDNSVRSVYRGDSRINSCLESLYGRQAMMQFRDSYFESGAAMGVIIETEQVLSSKIKDRQEREWQQKYNPKRSNGRPLILDGGMKAKTVSTAKMTDLAFNESVTEAEKKVAVALGIPPILLDSGNNANIKPNLELLFYLTILPMLRKFESVFEYFFARDLELSIFKVPALKPDQKEQAERITSLVNNGIITGNEGRAILRLEPIEEEVMKKIRIPANVAGSATGVAGQEGGKPSNKE